MTKNTLPTYAIVELLIRLSQYDPLIGDYKGHAVNHHDVIVKTTQGSIAFSLELIKRQFEAPESITDETFIGLAKLFKPLR
ncbi:hypothetical protein [Mucilaginibacter paludis]|uniref:Uncharacterized protein n=1 Tax=Mucilaginibacter paludis DSM 18603 TaxID=714943 RepID=H1XZW3_9SPHI|nr:hypothetical protein [Mucilaginibacter paludis]EHQ27805.1 hypothetical protein Mucpa_3707 [Mucilaginibacter paludis DSM 18603]